MTNPRSASNAWAVLKKKLMTPTDGSAPPPTPKKGGGRKKKVDSGEGGDATPKKPATPRKRAKKDVEDGEESPQLLAIATQSTDRVQLTISRSTQPGSKARTRDAVLVSEVTFAGPTS